MEQEKDIEVAAVVAAVVVVVVQSITLVLQDRDMHREDGEVSLMEELAAQPKVCTEE
jgi:hypothetical protein